MKKRINEVNVTLSDDPILRAYQRGDGPDNDHTRWEVQELRCGGEHPAGGMFPDVWCHVRTFFSEREAREFVKN